MSHRMKGGVGGACFSEVCLMPAYTSLKCEDELNTGNSDELLFHYYFVLKHCSIYAFCVSMFLS